MKQLLCIFSFLCVAFVSFSQNAIDEKYQRAYILLKSGKTEEAYKIYKEIRPLVGRTDTIYNYVVWYDLSATSQLEEISRKKEDFESSLVYGLEALSLIKENKGLFDEKFAEREPWMVKNIIISYVGLGKLEDAKRYKDILYKGYKEKTLPKGIDGYFNYDFFTIDDKNIWGYEWYPELPDNRFSGSFTKVVYYVYSRNPDGTDKDQLYRLHVLMFHQDAADAKFDYILERQLDDSAGTVSGSYYKYTYKKEIDYKKLKEDVKHIITMKLEPNTRRTVTIRKN